MRAWLLAVVVLAMLAGTSRAGNPAPLEAIEAAWTKARKVVWRLEGRVLACLI